MDVLKIIPDKIKDEVNECKIEKEIISRNYLRLSFKFKGGQKASLFIRRFVDKKIFFFGLGLFAGEGTKRRRKDKKALEVELTNSNPKLILCFLNFLEEFGFDREKCKARIQISCQRNEIEKIVEKTTIFWQRITKIPIKNFNKPNVRIRENPKQKSENGSLDIRFFSKPFWRLLEFWINNPNSLLDGPAKN